MSNRNSRRSFLKKVFGFGSGMVGFSLGRDHLAAQNHTGKSHKPPVVISTWRHGLPSNEAAVKILQSRGNALEAVEKGVNVAENDPEVTSVGYGGYPDEEGIVSLDACIMDWNWNCGSVGAVQNIKNPVSVARKVMDMTDHIMLVGAGAKQFALRTGFTEENLLTEQAREWWLNWRRNLSPDDDWINSPENHDTISMIALDQAGQIAGATTTSGLAGKIHGRVGDSPLIGSGLYVDGEVGAAGATGRGEEFIRTNGCHTVVENMRHGMSPQQAAEDALQRIIKINHNRVDFQGAFIAMNTEGEIGAASIQPGFEYALYASGDNALHSAPALMR